MNVSRALHTSEWKDGKVYVFGGENRGKLANWEIFDVSNNVWTNTADLPRPLRCSVSTVQ